MEETEFHACADATLDALESALEVAETADLEAELLNGILTIGTEKGQFVVNKHLPTRQLWLASPLSGAARFAYDGTWRHNITGEELGSFLKRELELA